MRTVRVEGKTIDEAIAKGLEELGVNRVEAIVNVIEEPSAGLFGLINKKPAIVEVSAPDSIEILSNPVKTDNAENEVSPVISSKEEKIEETHNVEIEENCENEEIKEKEEFVFSAQEQADVAEIAKEFLTSVFKGMNLEVTMEKMVNEERILFNLHGEGLGILIGKHGQTLDALQYLTNLASGKKYRRRYFVMLDVENYRERRRHTLESLAKRLASKAKRTGEAVKLEPMNAAERRIIHLALQDDDEITTDSEGEGRFRHIVISLK